MRDKTFRIVNRGYDPVARVIRRLRPGNRLGFVLSDGRRVRRARPIELPGDIVLENIDVFCDGVSAGVIDVMLVGKDGSVTSMGSATLKEMAEGAKPAEVEEPVGDSDSVPEGGKVEDQNPPADESASKEETAEPEEPTAEPEVEAESEEPTAEPEVEAEPEETEEESFPEEPTAEPEVKEGNLPEELVGATISGLKRKYNRAKLAEIAVRVGIDPSEHSNEGSLARALVKFAKEQS